MSSGTSWRRLILRFATNPSKKLDATRSRVQASGEPPLARRGQQVRDVAATAWRSLFHDNRTEVDLAASFTRNLLRLLWLLPGLGIAFVLIDLHLVTTGELDQRLGDLAAGSVVIREP